MCVNMCIFMYICIRHTHIGMAAKIISSLHTVITQGYHTCSLTQTPHVILLNEKFYHQHLKPLLADYTANWLTSGQYAENLGHEEIKDFLLLTTEEMKETEGVGRIVGKVNRLESNVSKELLNLGMCIYIYIFIHISDIYVSVSLSHYLHTYIHTYTHAGLDINLKI